MKKPTDKQLELLFRMFASKDNLLTAWDYAYSEGNEKEFKEHYGLSFIQAEKAIEWMRNHIQDIARNKV